MFFYVTEVFVNVDYLEKIKLLERENKKLKNKIKQLSDWITILTETKSKLQQKIQVLETSIKNFGRIIDEDLYK